MKKVKVKKMRVLIEEREDEMGEKNTNRRKGD